MIHVESSTQVNQARQEVFAYLTEVQNFPKWAANVAEASMVSEGALRVGAQFQQTIRFGGRKLRAVCTVTDYKPNERFAFAMKSDGPIDCDARFDLYPVASGSRLTLHAVARPKGLWRLLTPVMSAELRRETQSELEAMKTQIEAGAFAAAR